MKKLTLPKWVKQSVAKDALFNTKDMCDAFKVSREELDTLIQQGDLPSSNVWYEDVIKKDTGYRRSYNPVNAYYWQVDYLIKFFEEDND